MVLRTFETEEELYSSFKSLCAKENVNVGDKINELMKKYYKEHGDGNPAFTLDQFVEDSGMKAVPAFFRTIEDWDKYLYDLPSSEVKEILCQSQSIQARSKNRLIQRGDNV